jgi:hypothetical protein
MDPRILDLGLVGGEWSGSLPGRPQSRYDRCVEETNLISAGIRTPVVQSVVRRYTH